MGVLAAESAGATAGREGKATSPDGTICLLLSPPGATLSGLLVTVEPEGGTAEAYAHAGHEFGFVSSGEVELVVDSARYVLRAGDSFAFKSTLLHSVRNPGPERCVILWVNTTRPSEVRDGA